MPFLAPCAVRDSASVRPVIPKLQLVPRQDVSHYPRAGARMVGKVYKRGLALSSTAPGSRPMLGPRSLSLSRASGVMSRNRQPLCVVASTPLRGLRHRGVARLGRVRRGAGGGCGRIDTPLAGSRRGSGDAAGKIDPPEGQNPRPQTSQGRRDGPRDETAGTAGGAESRRVEAGGRVRGNSPHRLRRRRRERRVASRVARDLCRTATGAARPHFPDRHHHPVRPPRGNRLVPARRRPARSRTRLELRPFGPQQDRRVVQSTGVRRDAFLRRRRPGCRMVGARRRRRLGLVLGRMPRRRVPPVVSRTGAAERRAVHASKHAGRIPRLTRSGSRC